MKSRRSYTRTRLLRRSFEKKSPNEPLNKLGLMERIINTFHWMSLPSLLTSKVTWLSVIYYPPSLLETWCLWTCLWGWTHFLCKHFYLDDLICFGNFGMNVSTNEHILVMNWIWIMVGFDSLYRRHMISLLHVDLLVLELAWINTLFILISLCFVTINIPHWCCLCFASKRQNYHIHGCFSCAYMDMFL